MQDKLAEINGKIQAAQERFMASQREIIALANADKNPQRNSPTADKIRELDKQRREAFAEKQRLKAERAELLDVENVLARRKNRRQQTARDVLKGAIEATSGKAGN